MKTFEHHFLTEWKLPRIETIIDPLISRGYIQKIINTAPKSIKTQTASSVSVLRYTNPYNNEKEILDIRVVYKPDIKVRGWMRTDRNRTDITYRFIFLNWFAIMKTYKETRIPIRRIVERVLRHEITHAIDLQARYATHKERLLNPTEINAQMSTIVDDIKYALRTGTISLSDIKAQIIKPTDKFIAWIPSNKGSKSILRMYADTRPDIIERLRKLLHYTFLSTSPEASLAQP